MRIRLTAATVMVAALCGLAAFSSTAVGAPPLSKAPRSFDFGQQTAFCCITRGVTITNNTDTTLGPGTYELSGDVPKPFSGLDLAASDCDATGDPIFGTTKALAPGEDCIFRVGYDGVSVAPGRYRAKLSVTFGDRKTSISATVRVVP